MNPTLTAFAESYLKSSAAKNGGKKDYTIDWEKFLRLAGVHDGDERESAVQDLLAAERRSEGMFVIERDKSGSEKLLKLKLGGGERWLFDITGCVSPADGRRKLADFFQGASAVAVPEIYSDGWRSWCADLEARALTGDSVAPFRRDDPDGNALFLKALAGVLNWEEESLIQRAGSVIGGDSKMLGRFRPRLVSALAAITSGERVSLADFGIVDAPRSAWIHGPLGMELAGGRMDLGLLSGPAAISAIDLAACHFLDCRAKVCLTIENECVFHELAGKRTGVLLIQTSFPGAATRLLFERLPPDLTCYHFGDSDPAGFAILHDLCERTGRVFKPLMMGFRDCKESTVLTDGEKKVISRLLSSGHLPEESLCELRKMLAAGVKGAFEQESLPIGGMLEEIRSISGA